MTPAVCPRCSTGDHHQCVETFNRRWRNRCACALGDHAAPERTCTIDGCDRPHCARGWCRGHYRRWHRTGDPGPADIGRPTRRDIGCDADGCSEPHYARGRCRVHYYRVQRGGEPGDASIYGRSSTCTIDDCRRPHNSGGLCRPHAYRRDRYGDPHAGRPVPPLATRRLCRIDGCRRDVTARRLCKTHYDRLRNGRPLDDPQEEPLRRCQLDGCDRYHLARGWCALHYQRVQRDGHPGPVDPKPAGRDRIHNGCNVDGCERPHRARGLCKTHVRHLYENTSNEIAAAAAPSSHDDRRAS